MKDHAVLVLKNENKILFVKRSLKKKSLPGLWSFPSGTVEQGEEIYQTIIREAKEELDVEVQPQSIFAKKELTEFSVQLHFVLCKILNGKAIINEPDEIDKIEWMTFQDFFNKFSDTEIGHGLVWLRKNPQIWENL
jgi:8-oxo-dGTP diphosphatase